MSEDVALAESIKKAGFNFSVRIAELVKYLKVDDKSFPLAERLLVYGVDVGFACREIGIDKNEKEAKECLEKADYIIEIAVTGGYLSEVQSVRIRGDCRLLADMLEQYNLREDEVL